MVEKSKRVYCLRCECAILSRASGGGRTQGSVSLMVEVEVRSL